jgi:hypothetical protein
MCVVHHSSLPTLHEHDRPESVKGLRISVLTQRIFLASA